MEPSAREKFYERIEAAPLAARGFFESVDEHFRQRNDVDARFTHTNVANMRLWAGCETDTGKQREQVFATMTWKPTKQAVSARTKLSPDEFFNLVSETLYRQMMRTKRRTAKYSFLTKIGDGALCR